jgi:hypothetical protein
VVTNNVAIGCRQMTIGQGDPRRDAFTVGRHQQERRCAVQAERVRSEITSVTIEKPKPRRFLNNLSVLASQKEEIVRLED